MAQGGQGIGGFPGLGDGDDKLVRVGHRGTVAVFAGDFDSAGQAGDSFEPVAGGEARMVAGAAGQDQDGTGFAQYCRGFGAENAGLDGLAAAHHFQGVGQASGCSKISFCM